jgi:hypothetical protein
MSELKKKVSADAPKAKTRPEPPERVPIDRSVEVESGRRGLEAMRWAVVLMNASGWLLIAAIVFSLVAAFFAWRQAPAEVYVTTTDGGLFLAPSVTDPKQLPERFLDLTAEDRAIAEARKAAPASSNAVQGPTSAAASAAASAVAAGGGLAGAPGAADSGAGGSPGANGGAAQAADPASGAQPAAADGQLH